MTTERCLVCDYALAEAPTEIGIRSCPRCGSYIMLTRRVGEAFDGSLRQFLETRDGFGPTLSAEQIDHRRARLSHIVRLQQRNGQTTGIPLGRLADWTLDAPLPTPSEQYNNLILWIGDQQPNYAVPARAPFGLLSAWIGAPITPDRNFKDPIRWLLTQEVPVALIQVLSGGGDELIAKLTLAGWERHRQLKEQKSSSRHAFMAMQFNDDDVQRAFRDCFSPAVTRAGFELQRLIDGQPAGCIDDQLRVALRTSRFIISDLTNGNSGAYWEAGFAEGLGSPVIYTCRKAEWESQKTHFDTNHMVTIIWDPANLSDAENRLTALIRATLPEEAKLTD